VPGLGALALTTHALLLPKLAILSRLAGSHASMPSRQPQSVQSKHRSKRQRLRLVIFARNMGGIMAAEAAGLRANQAHAVVAGRLQPRKNVVDLPADDRARWAIAVYLTYAARGR